MDTCQILGIVLQFLTLIFLAIYVVKTSSIATSNRDSVEETKKLIEETRISRDEETAPRVIAFFDLQDQIAEFVVRNTGKSTANNVKISINPDISNLLDNENRGKHYNALLGEGIKMFVPNQEIRAFLNRTPDIFEKKGIPMTYNIEISYEGGLLNKQRVYQCSVNLEAFKHLVYIHKPSIKDVVNELEKLIQAVQRLNK